MLLPRAMAGTYEDPKTGDWVDVPRPIPLADVERNAILNALAYTHGHQRQAAALLGISPRVLHYKLKTIGIICGDSR